MEIYQVNRYDPEGLRSEIEENKRLVRFIFSGSEVINEGIISLKDRHSNSDYADKSNTENVLENESKLDDKNILCDVNNLDIENLKSTKHVKSTSDSIEDFKSVSDNIIDFKRYIRADRITGIGALENNNKLSYYHIDEQLSTSYITSNEGDVENYYKYDVFGNAREQEENVANRFTYTGQQYDTVTGQYYLRARYYNPVVGRFLQEDVYRGDGLNLYAYVGNNPVTYYDPSGYEQCKVNQFGDEGTGGGKTTAEIKNPVLDNTRSGSALKGDSQHAFNDIIDNYAGDATMFPLKGGDGVNRLLYQIEGSLNGKKGIFEWIVDPDAAKGVTHRRFIEGVGITGKPNARP